jgi:thiamine kinase-like enzyme
VEHGLSGKTTGQSILESKTMNQEHLKLICTKLQIGTPQKEVASVFGCRGGSFMWRVNTEKGSYAIKQLAPMIDLRNEKIIAKYELSETIAYRFSQQGIRAVSAIKESGKHLSIIDNTGYLVYPWVEGHTLGRNEISETHALKIAEVIAQLHNINMSVPEIEVPHVDIHAKDSIVEAIERAVSFKCPFANMLKENQNLILSMYDHYLAAVPLLLEDTVVTHGDLDQLNVLWDKAGQPILIDWESVRKLNPTREIIRTSLSWSGIGTNEFLLTIYSHMLDTYIKCGRKLNVDHINAALHGLIGSSVNWMLFNIKIACTSEVLEEKNNAAKEINSSLMAIKKAKILIPELFALSSAVK